MTLKTKVIKRHWMASSQQKVFFDVWLASFLQNFANFSEFFEMQTIKFVILNLG